MCLNKIYSKIHVDKHLSDTFPIQNGLKQRDVLLPLLFNSALEYAIRKVQIFGDSRDVGLEINAEKT
jgi:hypothetical protein